MLKIKITTAIIYLSATLFLTSCMSTPTKSTDVPLWVNNPEAVYSENEYMVAVGYAADRTTAESQAVANLSKTLKQKVEAESTATQIFENNLEDQSRTYNTSVKTSTLIDEIMGITIQETWTAKDETVYALALVNRKEVGSYYLQKITENETAINGFLSFLIDNEATFEGILAAQKALALALENEGYLELLSVINSSMYNTHNPAYKSAAAISVLILLEKEKIYVGTYIPNDVDNRVSNAITTAFKNAGYKSGTLSTFEAPSASIPYVLYGELIISPFQMTSSQNNKYVRFTFNSELVGLNNKTFLPWGISGREAHLTEEEAANRAIRTIEEKIEKEFLLEIHSLIN